MATLSLPQGANPSDWFVQTGLCSTAGAQSAEGVQVRLNAQLADTHWRSRAEYVLHADAASDAYVSIPFKPVKTIRVTYRKIGALKPALYRLGQ